MTTKHTQGEWKAYRAQQLGVELKSSFIVMAGNCKIEINRPFAKSQTTPEDAKAIAKLIAAAPDLLEALIDAKRSISWSKDLLHDKIERAIKKATT